MSEARALKLEDSKKLQQFLRDVDEVCIALQFCVYPLQLNVKEVSGTIEQEQPVSDLLLRTYSLALLPLISNLQAN